MTIVVGAASPDGIVLAADSRTTLSDGQRHRIATDSAEKLFGLHNRFGVATYGIALLGDQTINGVMNEFVAAGDEEACQDVETFANALGSFFTDRFNQVYPDYEATPSGWPLGFVVAGYDSAGVGHVWEIAVPGPVVSEQTDVTTRVRGLLWRGQMDVIGRLVKGIDYQALAEADVGLPDEIVETLKTLEYIILMPATLQDAVGLAAFLVRTTVDMQRFSDGTALSPGLVPGCGGEIQMLSVTPTGVDWISRRWFVGPTRPGLAEGSTVRLDG